MSHSKELYAYYLLLARAACSPGSFVGIDMRFSNEFEALEGELGKAQSVHGNGLPDWQRVSEISECLLREHSKDLRVACWLTWALYQRDSLAGLLAGLGVLRELCEHHWVHVYPGKLRTRVAAFGWLVSRLEQAFAKKISLNDQQPLFQALLEHLEHLDQLWAQHLGSDAPVLLPIRRQLAERLADAAQGAPEADGGAGAIPGVRQAAVQLPTPEQSVNSEKEAHKLLRSLQEQARPLCAWWLRQNATDLRALRLGRTLAWLMLVNYPDANSERITALRPLAADKLKRYQERLSQGHYADVLFELEVSLAGALFWFDGLRMAWECLDGLHADLAMAELEIHFALLLQRLPNLTEYRFDDGTPFADTATAEWIALHVMRHVRKPAPSEVVTDLTTQPWDAALDAVMPCLRKDGLKAAVGVIKQGLQGAVSDRCRFHWRLALARLCMAAGKHELARIQLEQLDLQLQRTGLESWEPALALQVAQLLYRCYDLLPQSQAIRDGKDALHRRLCHFDLEAVLQ
ncbi:type VI secretion system protein TssA [Pseudomonas sp. P867]|uniref:type VI secretion system protein TssA n=1 Tax=Pseudomonas sp. P867 TaxID=2816050 RepID=UPI001CA63800|nr:type VI secretion system protein TssA [Pseudomonas sp. P867]MBY8972639.1 type VI secretion system protein TssA [Pseudomonas sp. P867]